MIFNPEMELMPRAQLKTLQAERLRRVCERVYERVGLYRTAFDARGLKPGAIRGIDDLHKLPFTRKSDLREHYPFGLLTVPVDEVARIHGSSGTTGRPTVVAYTRADLEVFAEVVARSLAAAGARPGMMLHNAYGYGLFTGGLGLQLGADRLGMTVVPISGGQTERQVQLIGDFKPHVIACTPSYALTLADVFKERGIPPEEIPLQFGIHGAEPWGPEMRQAIEAGLGLKATNIFGLSEIIGPGVSNEDVSEQDGAYIWEDHFYPEIVDSESGEPVPDGEWGVLVLTTLTKEALPLLRYFTGDITRLLPGEGSTGRTHRRMDFIRGRSDDMLIVRGVNLYPSQIEEFLGRAPELSPHYQLVVAREATLDELTVRVEATEAFVGAVGDLRTTGETPPEHPVLRLQARVQSLIREAIGVTVTIRIEPPGSLPRSEGGKLRRVVDRRKIS